MATDPFKAADVYSIRLNPRYDEVMKLVQLTYRYVSRYDNGVCTVGWAGMDTLELDLDLWRTYGVKQDYLSGHLYTTSLPVFRNAIRLKRRQSAVYPDHPPVVCSEFWEAAYRGSLAGYLQVLMEECAGGQMWGFLQNNSFQNPNTSAGDFDGVVAPPPAASITKLSGIVSLSRLAGKSSAEQKRAALDLRAVARWTRAQCNMPLLPGPLWANRALGCAARTRRPWRLARGA